MAITRGTRPVIVHLSGAHRGTTQVLYGERIRIGTGADTEIHFPPDREPAVSTLHAELRREAAHYALFAAPGETVRVNNELVESRVLGSNDVIEIGENGPFLRYRVYHGAGGRTRRWARPSPTASTAPAGATAACSVVSGSC